MRLVLLQIGRLRDPHVTALRDEYVKRLGRFGSLTVIEREPKGEASLWPASTRWRVALDERGTTYDSPAFAKQLEKWTMSHGEVGFCVGEAYGHHAPTLAAANATWSLGALTLPHALAHVLVAEQLYRAATILAGTGYHHA
jgi:23S rRNA (pseudouridine1915-N3)-methyltransferase